MHSNTISKKDLESIVQRPVACVMLFQMVGLFVDHATGKHLIMETKHVA